MWPSPPRLVPPSSDHASAGFRSALRDAGAQGWPPCSPRMIANGWIKKFRTRTFRDRYNFRELLFMEQLLMERSDGLITYL